MNVTANDRMDPMAAPSAEASKAYRLYVLFALFVLNTLSFVDRQIFSILAPPIKAELGLSDTELGLIGGTAFALFYTALGIPVARLAERVNRVAVMAVALGLWSVFTALTGQVGGFWQLFWCRLGVGVGEAGGGAPAHSLITDHFPSAQRGQALAAHSFGVPVGAALAFLCGGYLVTQVGWRAAFLVCGVAGLLFAPVLALTVRERPRGALDAGPQAGYRAGTVPGLADVLRLLAGRPAYWLLALGAAVASMMSYGLAFWLPSFLVRTFHVPLGEALWMLGLVILFAGVGGCWMGGLMGDRLGRVRRSRYATVPAASLALTVPFYAIALGVDSAPMAVAACILPQAFAHAWFGPVFATVQQLVPPSMRTTAAALFIFILNLIGLGGGPLLLGALSDMLTPQFGADALRYSILASLPFYLLAALLLFLAGRRLDRDWEKGGHDAQAS